MAAVTRLGLYGGSRSPYGSFAGKVAAPPVFSGTIANISEDFDTGTYQYDISTYFTGATSYSIAPSVEAGWSFNTSVALGGVRKRKIKPMPKHFFPWEKEEDEYIEEIIKEIKRPKLKIVKRAPQPDFDSTLSLERIDRELILELQKSEEIRKKRIRRRKTIEMLLLS